MLPSTRALLPALALAVLVLAPVVPAARGAPAGPASLREKMEPAARDFPGERLAQIQFRGVMSLGDTVQVCLVDGRTGTGSWLPIGEPPGPEALAAVRYDRSSERLLVRWRGREAWLPLAGAQVRPRAVARMEDGGIDWVYERMTTQQREQEAVSLMFDMLSVGQAARRGPVGPVARPVSQPH